ncbi:MAG TPA: hypothetical protein VF495_07460, partial [Phenylobacterium sp.]
MRRPAPAGQSERLGPLNEPAPDFVNACRRRSLRRRTAMSGVPTSDLKAYFAEARTWDHDRLAAA